MKKHHGQKIGSRILHNFITPESASSSSHYPLPPGRGGAAKVYFDFFRIFYTKSKIKWIAPKNRYLLSANYCSIIHFEIKTSLSPPEGISFNNRLLLTAAWNDANIMPHQSSECSNPRTSRSRGPVGSANVMRNGGTYITSNSFTDTDESITQRTAATPRDRGIQGVAEQGWENNTSPSGNLSRDKLGPLTTYGSTTLVGKVPLTSLVWEKWHSSPPSPHIILIGGKKESDGAKMAWVWGGGCWILWPQPPRGRVAQRALTTVRLQPGRRWWSWQMYLATMWEMSSEPQVGLNGKTPTTMPHKSCTAKI